jgi:hypothetical protein
VAHAGESARCRRARADAEATAAVLRWPRLLAEGIRFPSNNRLDLGPTVGNNWQGRVGAMFSPLDFLRGSAIEDVSEASCALADATARWEAAFAARDDGPRARALAAQADYLDGHRAEWEALRTTADARLKARVITNVERHEIFRLTEELERKAATARGESARLLARRVSANPAPQDAESLTREISARTMVLADREARVRRLDAWGFRVTSGIIPMPGQPLDWYGIAEVSYSLGGIAQSRAQSRAMEALHEELTTDVDQAAFRLAQQNRELGELLAQARQELTIVEGTLSRTRAMTQVMAGADAPDALHARDTLTLERLSAESDRAFLTTLIEQLTPLVADATRP